MVSSSVLAMQIVLGAVFGLVAAALAYRLKLLTKSGSLAAFLMGWIVFGFGGGDWAVLLIFFFVTSSGLSFLFKKRKKQAESMAAKGATRDYGQVLANGGVATLFVLIHFIAPESNFGWIGFCSALAAATADTWATELGIINHSKPFMITSGKLVEAGSSGAVSLAGLLAAMVGAGLIGVLAWFFSPQTTSVWVVAVVAAAGLIGSLVDSLFGATCQGIYFCPKCQKETEKTPLHGCGEKTRLIRGKAWLNNDWVNTFCTISGSGLAILIYWLI